MNLGAFNQIVTEHRNSLIVIGGVILAFCIVGIIIVEIYVRGKMDLKYIKIKRIKFSPSLLLLIPALVTIIYFSSEVIKCNNDVRKEAYDTYVGRIEYSSSSVKLLDEDISIFVGKNNEKVPYGEHYGKCIISHDSRVIVFWEELNGQG